MEGKTRERSCYCGWQVHPLYLLDSLVIRKYAHLRLRGCWINYVTKISPWHWEIRYEKYYPEVDRECLARIKVDDVLDRIIVPSETIPERPGVWFCSRWCKEQFEKDLKEGNLKVNLRKVCCCGASVEGLCEKTIGDVLLCSEECTAYLLYKTMEKLLENGIKVKKHRLDKFYFYIETENETFTIHDVVNGKLPFNLSINSTERTSIEVIPITIYI